MNDFYKEQYAERPLKKPNKNISFETIGARRIYGNPHRFHSDKPNRNVTLQSLIAFFQLLETENQEDFCINYLIAFHDNNGPTVWNLMDYKYQNKWNHKAKERKLAKEN